MSESRNDLVYVDDVVSALLSHRLLINSEKNMKTELEDEKELILVVEDSEFMNDFIAKNLIAQNYSVVQCFSVKDALKKLAKNAFSLVILDLNLGDDENESGMKVLHTIRLQNKMLPVIIVSSIQDKEIKLQGFREGCDDFILKPFYMEELILRVNRLLEKFSFSGFEKQKIEDSYSCGIFELDVENKKVSKRGKNISMRKKQFDLILYFMKNPNKILSLEAIFQNVWNEPVPDEKTLEANIYVNIRSLRNLIEDDKKNPRHIVSVSKCGYIFVPE